jgi:uncharacterized protein
VNRLTSATSPYLLQHADNPVDWWEWSQEAFASARARDVPVLISVGYSACHWCHVMAHQSFEDAGVGTLINENFVAIKVDREERPDVDAVYMTATQAMTGQGGWPMTVFATPDGEPFYCGTYFPRANFIQLLTAIAEAWKTQRLQVLAQGQAVVKAIAGAPAAGSGQITPALLDHAAGKLLDSYDPGNGGFGGAPKFPPHLALLFLLRQHQRTGSMQTLEIVRHTAEAMARGGIHDQLAGGFARYAVDEHWTVPHFEKMLYDNALLLRVYTELWRLTGDRMAARVAADIVGFLDRDLRAGGAFASALDADTDGVEGLTYAWTPQQLVEALGEDDGRWAADLFTVTLAGTFEHGSSVLRLARDIDDAAPEVTARWADVRARLLRARGQRPQPAMDDKVVAAWNGLAITALAEFARVSSAYTATVPDRWEEHLRDAGLLAAGMAGDAGATLARVHLVDGRLRRVSRNGVVGSPAGVLEDYGCVAEAFCALHQALGETERREQLAEGVGLEHPGQVINWLELAGELLDTALARFGDGQGGFFDTADDAEKLVTRPADPTDNATPSGTSAIISALLAYSALTGEPSYREAAEQALEKVTPLINGHPRFAGYSAAAAEALISGPMEIAIVTDDELAEPLLATAVLNAPGGTVIVAGPSDRYGVPLLAGRPPVDGAPAAYVCRDFVCNRPVTTAADLTTMLTR